MQRDNGSQGSSRRDVLKTSAALGAAAVLTGLGGNFAHAAGSDTFKVGLIGCGGRGSGAARDCMEGSKRSGANVTIAAVGDVFEGQARGQQKAWKLPDDKCFWGLDAYKKVIDSGVDMVILATPPGFRPYHFQYAIEKGKHVFFEKPVAVDPTGIRIVMETADIAKQKGLGVVAGTQRRHESNYIETIKRIHDGAIGDIMHMSVYWNGGGIWARNREPWMSDVEYQIHNWYHYIWTCGDHIVEQHVHNLDVANWVMGGHPISAYGMGGRQVRRDPGQIWDHFAIEYEYANGGRVLSFCRHWPETDGNVSEFAIGTKGMSNPGGWIQPTGGRRQGFRNNGSGYVLEHADLQKSIMDGKPLNEGRQVAESTMNAIMGRMSAYTGKRVSWDFAMNSKLNTMPANLDLKGKLPEPPVPMPGTEKLI